MDTNCFSPKPLRYAMQKAVALRANSAAGSGYFFSVTVMLRPALRPSLWGS
jgi:hypothetical protein